MARAPRQTSCTRWASACWDLRCSEHKPRADLNLPRRLIPVRIRRQHLGKVRSPQHVAGNIEIRMVEQIEEVAPEHQPMVFTSERPALRQPEIDVGVTRAGEDVAPF